MGGSVAEYNLRLPSSWVNASSLEHALARTGEPHADVFTSVRCTLPVGCKVMIDAGTRMLSLANQLASGGKQVTLEFEEGIGGVMGYLDRLSFFDLLDRRISVVPDPPVQSAGSRRRGHNPDLVELRAISPRSRDRELPKQLADAVEEACCGRDDRTTLGHAAYTVFAELIDNIFEHSETEVDGCAGLQVYRGGGSVWVAVSDSGRGILDTIRPSLKGKALRHLSDPELIVHMFNEGVSRFGSQRGCGLRRCAEHALKYKARLLLRLRTSELELVPGNDGYEPVAYIQTCLPEIHGTHIVFQFRLDRQS